MMECPLVSSKMCEIAAG